MFQAKLKNLIDQPKHVIFAVAMFISLPWFHVLAILLLLLVTLRKGWQEGLLVATVASVVSGIVSLFFLKTSLPFLLLHLFMPFLFWFIAVILHYTASWPRVITIIMLFGLCIVGLIYHFYPEIALQWNQLLIHNVDQIVQTRMNLKNTIQPNEWTYLLGVMGKLAVGFRVLLLSVMTISLLMIARYLQALLYNPGGFKKEFYSWHFNYQMGGFITLLTAIAFVTHEAVWISMIPVAVLPTVFSGISLLHFSTAHFRYQLLILILFYGSVLTIFPQLLLLVMFAGYSDCFLNFRKYIKGADL